MRAEGGVRQTFRRGVTRVSLGRCGDFSGDILGNHAMGKKIPYSFIEMSLKASVKHTDKSIAHQKIHDNNKLIETELLTSAPITAPQGF